MLPTNLCPAPYSPGLVHAEQGRGWTTTGLLHLNPYNIPGSLGVSARRAESRPWDLIRFIPAWESEPSTQSLTFGKTQEKSTRSKYRFTAKWEDYLAATR